MAGICYGKEGSDDATCIKRAAHYFSHNMHTHPIDTEQAVENWLKTQTFAQLQQFGPSWDDAPKDAVKASVFVQFYDKDNVSLQFRRDLSNFERPKPPVPVVEVGQVWRYKDYNYTISSVGRLKITDAWLDSVCYKTDSGIFYTRTLSDFLAKFEQVQS
jgi:hypothetical protein